MTPGSGGSSPPSETGGTPPVDGVSTGEHADVVTPTAAADGTSDESAGPQGGSTRRRGKERKQLPLWQETILMVGTAVVLALLIKTFFIQAFYIPSGSMRDTLQVNDRILVQKVSYWFGDVQRGDIVVFDDPANWLGEEAGQVPGNALTKAMSFVGLYPSGGHLVKRVIGVGGDTVACQAGEVKVNRVGLQESGYVTLAQNACDGHWSVVVPADHIWVLGDNRENSADSRAHTGDPGGGYIPVADVVGKAFVIVWPVDRWQFIHRPATFDNPQLDQAVAAVSGAAPAGPVALVVPALVWRRRRARRP